MSCQSIIMSLYKYCVLSSCIGSMSGILGKWASNPQILLNYIRFIEYYCNRNQYIQSYHYLVLYIVQGILYITMILLNGIMLNTTVKSMNTYGTLHTTTLNTAIGFILSGISGVIFFDEIIGIQWCIGMICVIAGVFLIQLDQSNNKIE